MSSTVAVSYTQARNIVTRYILAGIVPFLRGSPGVGKSAMIQDIATTYDMCVIDFRLSQADPTDLSGFPTIANGVASYVPMDIFPLANTPLPINPQTKAPYAGWILFFDEFNSASPAVQKATYKVILDRMIGNHALNEKVIMVCAGNLETDNALTGKLSTAMQSRLGHIEISKDNSKEWLAWAPKAQLDHRVTSFIGFKPDLLNDFRPDHQGYTFPCQRTWEFVSKAIANTPTLTIADDLHALAGLVGEGAANEFIGFTQIFNSLPSIQAILANPTGTPVPSDIGAIWALTGLLATHADGSNAKAIMAYADRLPSEFTVLTMQNAVRRSKTFINNEVVHDWVVKNREDLI